MLNRSYLSLQYAFYLGWKQVACSLAVILLASIPLRGLQAQGQGSFAGAQIVTIEGELEAIAGNKFKIKSEGEEIFGILDKKSKLTYTNTAESSFLMPGILIRFEADFDTKTDTPTQPISKVEIFRQVRKPRMSRNEIQAQTPGIYPVKQEGGGATGGQVQRFKIVGSVRAVQDTKMQIVAGRPLMIDLAEGVEIGVQSGDTAFCQPGDKIKVTGLKNANQANLMQMQTVSIEGSQPLAKATAKPRRSRTDRKTPGAATGADGAKKGSSTKKPNDS